VECIGILPFSLYYYVDDGNERKIKLEKNTTKTNKIRFIIVDRIGNCMLLLFLQNTG
jgi:hypothetical protein